MKSTRKKDVKRTKSKFWLWAESDPVLASIRAIIIGCLLAGGCLLAATLYLFYKAFTQAFY